MSITAVGPSYASAWTTLCEKSFVDGLGTWCPLALHSKRYRIECLRGYLDSLELRAFRGSVDWSVVRDHALGLLAQALEDAA